MTLIGKKFAPYSLFIAITLHYCGMAGAEDQLILSDDGREILLRDNGTWTFASPDRYANTPDGQRIRLKPDNTWEPVGNTPLHTEKQLRTLLTDIRLHQISVETQEEKVHKNKRVITHTVIELRVSVSPLASQALTLTEDTKSSIQVRDDKGQLFDILSISPSPLTMAPHSSHAIMIRADGSPSWWSTSKFIELVLQAGVFGNEATIVLRSPIHEIEHRQVENLM